MAEPEGIFISYSHSDTEWVREFVSELRQQGISSWFDEAELKPGMVFTDAIENAFRHSDTLIFVVSPDSIHSKWFNFELGAALGTGKRIVPVVPEDMDPAQLPHPLRIRKYLQRRSPRQTAEAFASALAKPKVPVAPGA